MSRPDSGPRARLAIETSNPTAAADSARGASVAVGEVSGGTSRLLALEFLREVGREQDDLMPAINRVVRAAGLSAASISSVAVSVGPGGYTAVRVAVATAKMIALARGGSCVAVPSALVAERRVSADFRAAPHVVVLASKSGGGAGGESAWLHPVGLAGFTPALGAAAELERLIQAGARAVVSDRFLPESMRAAADRARAAIVPLELDAAACLEASADLPEIEPGLLLPVYPREPDAVRLWREKKR